MSIENDLQIPITSGEDIPDHVKTIRGVVDAIFANTNMRLRTVIKPRQLVALARLYFYAEHFNSKAAGSVAAYLTELAISQNGRSRDDMVSALKAILSGISEQEVEPTHRSLVSRFVNPFGR